MDSGPGFGLLSAMVGLFADQGITTVFEGIEENWQLELAEESGASMVQGYVLARPELAPTSFGAFLRTALPLAGVRRATVQHEHRRPAPVSMAPGRQFGRKTSSR
jgi:EAL domain-containing protein (putative c-di-GMP-specific phosphodiesterase class I)